MAIRLTSLSSLTEAMTKSGAPPPLVAGSTSAPTARAVNRSANMIRSPDERGLLLLRHVRRHHDRVLVEHLEVRFIDRLAVAGRDDHLRLGQPLLHRVGV